MLSIILDCETTGLDLNEDRIIEIGAQVVTDSWEVVASTTSLIHDPNIVLSKEIQEVTGISDELLKNGGIPREEAFSALSSIITSDVQVAVAYNSEFDEVMFKNEINRCGFGMMDGLNLLMQMPWVCAMRDVDKNYKFKCWKLSHIALDHGVAVDPKSLHRAINDVDLTRQMLKTIGETADSMLAFNREPWIYLRALIPAPWEDNGVGKAQAQKRGYTWEKAKGDDRVFEKAWVKKVKTRFVEDEVRTSPFKVRMIK